jgi:hypothetical protein
MHARVAPSSLWLTMACAASLTAGEPYKNRPSTDEEKEGDAAHWLALEFSMGRTYPLGHKTPNGVTVTVDMILGAELWASTIEPGGVAEFPVAIARIHETLCWGTPDYWKHIGGRHNILKVYDYKFGHMYVDPFENWQLLAYVAGLIDLLELQGYSENDMWVDMCIVQPRSYHKHGPVQYWRHPEGRLFKAHELRALINQAYMRVAEALKPEALNLASVGPHCMYCDARQACGALQRAAYHVAEFAGKAEPQELDSRSLGVELAILRGAMEILKARETGLAQQVESTLRAGQSVINFMLEPGQSRLKWKKTAPEVFAMGDAFDIDLRKPQEPITPTQAIDRFATGKKAKIDPSVISQYSDRPPAAMKLAESSTSETRKVFGL